MTRGILVAVVGASGTGKDSLLAGAGRLLEDAVLMRRTITRPASYGGENHLPATEEEFDRELERGGFLFHWEAHGFRYGIPAQARELAEDGRTVVFNGSRVALPRILEAWGDLAVVWVTAPGKVRASRLTGRGRESSGSVRSRLSRQAPQPPPGATIVPNDGSLERGAHLLADAIRRLSARCAASNQPRETTGGSRDA